MQGAAMRLLKLYEQAQREQRFGDCREIESAVRDWLLILRANETRLELPLALKRVLENISQPLLQRAALTLLCMIIGRLWEMRYDLFSLLSPSLLALAGLREVSSLQPASELASTMDSTIVDLAFILLSFMGRRGPGGLLLPDMRSFFARQPMLLRNLARASLDCGTLITPVPVPLQDQNFARYSAAIARWVKLRESWERNRKTEHVLEACLSIQQEVLACAEEVRYPVGLYIRDMLQRAASNPGQWRVIWQEYLLERLETASTISYQSSVLLWLILFPEADNLILLARRVLQQYQGDHISQQKRSTRFLATLSRDFRDFRDFTYFRDLGYLKDVKDFRYLGDARYFRDFRDVGYLKDLGYLGYLRDLRDLGYLGDLIDIGDLEYLRNMGYLGYLRDLRYLGYLGYLGYLRDLRSIFLTKAVAEKVRDLLLTQDTPASAELLPLIMGRLLQMQEEGRPAVQFQEIQALTASALACLPVGSSADEIVRSVSDVVRSLPARTANEIHFVHQVALNTQDIRLRRACAWALLDARPGDEDAWKEIRQSQASTVEEIRRAAEVSVQRYNKGAP